MHTLVLRNRPRKAASGSSTYVIEVVGDGPAKELVKQSIADLDHHPAPSGQRSLIDMLGIIDKHNFQIRYTEHYQTEDDLEAWLFVLQG